MGEKTKLPGIATSPDPAEAKKRGLEALFPEAFSEGRLDVAALKRVLGDGGASRMAASATGWIGPARATPTRCCRRRPAHAQAAARSRSVNFDQAQHVFIEGGEPGRC